MLVTLGILRDKSEKPFHHISFSKSWIFYVLKLLCDSVNHCKSQQNNISLFSNKLQK